MKILLVSSKFPPEYSGSGLRAHNTYKRLKEKFGIEYRVLASGVTEQGIGDYEYEGLAVHRISRKFPKRRFELPTKGRLPFWKRVVNQVYHARSYWAEAWPTWMWLNRHARDVDLIHVFGNVPVTRFAVTWTKITKKPVIIELVNLSDDPHHYEPVYFSWLYGKGFPKHAHLVAISPHLKNGAMRNGVPEERIWCRPNPVDEGRFCFCPQRKHVLRSLEAAFSKEDRVIVHVAKFMPLKNQIFLLQVLKQLSSEYKLLLAGPLVDSGPLAARDQHYFQTLEKIIEEDDLKERVLIHKGFIEQPENLFQMADVSVLPSMTEALGTPMLEALACGVPVVANRIEGVTDVWVEPGVNGEIEALDAGRWATAIQRGADYQDGQRRQIASEIIEKVSTKRIDADYYQLFKHVMEGVQ